MTGPAIVLMAIYRSHKSYVTVIMCTKTMEPVWMLTAKLLSYFDSQYLHSS